MPREVGARLAACQATGFSFFHLLKVLRTEVSASLNHLQTHPSPSSQCYGRKGDIEGRSQAAGQRARNPGSTPSTPCVCPCPLVPTLCLSNSSGASGTRSSLACACLCEDAAEDEQEDYEEGKDAYAVATANSPLLAYTTVCYLSLFCPAQQPPADC